MVFSIFLGCSLTAIGEKGSAIVHALDSLAHAMLKLTGYVMLFAPLTVFAAISALIAERGLAVMVSAGIFMGEFYFTMLLLWVLLIGLAIVYVGPCIRRLTRALWNPPCWHLPHPVLKRLFRERLKNWSRYEHFPQNCQLCLTHWLLI